MNGFQRPLSRQDAQSSGLTRYFTGRPCLRGHVCERLTCNKRCVECHRITDGARKATPEAKQKRSAYDRRRWRHDDGALRTKNRRYYAENADVVNAQKREYRRANLQKLTDARKRWVAENRAVIRAHNTARKKLVKRATPPWVDRDAILAVFVDAERRGRETGIEHHVDHIIPLKGEAVCGLHVPWNLRPLPAAENIAKKNKMLEP